MNDASGVLFCFLYVFIAVYAKGLLQLRVESYS